jgi:hypothetical protein
MAMARSPLRVISVPGHMAPRMHHRRRRVARHLEVQRHRALAAIDVLEQRALALDERPDMAVIVTVRALDFHHIGPEIGHQCGAVGSGQHTREVQNLESAQRFPSR